MAKKKKKKPIPPEVKLRRKIKKLAKRALMLSALVAGYFLLVPQLVPSYAPQVEQTKQTIVSVASQAQQSIGNILGSTSEITAELTSKKGEIEGKSPEALVQEVIDDLTQQVKELPREQVRKVKREFCSDVIEEAVLACEATGSGDKSTE